MNRIVRAAAGRLPFRRQLLGEDYQSDPDKSGIKLWEANPHIQLPFSIMGLVSGNKQQAASKASKASKARPSKASKASKALHSKASKGSKALPSKASKGSKAAAPNSVSYAKFINDTIAYAQANGLDAGALLASYMPGIVNQHRPAQAIAQFSASVRSRPCSCYCLHCKQTVNAVSVKRSGNRCTGKCPRCGCNVSKFAAKR